jgi:hypothetical protein
MITRWHSGARGAASSQLRLALEPIDLAAQRLVFGRLALKKAQGVARLFAQTLGGDGVEIGPLVRAIAKVVDLDEPAVDERSQAIVDLADADTQLLRQPPLGDAWIALQLAQDPEMLFFRSRPLCSTIEREAAH